MSDLITVFFTSIGSIVALFFLAKFMGYRQVSQMSMFDYINGITIGSIAAEMATSLEDDYLKPLLAMVIYAVCVVGIAYITDKSIKLRRFMEGKPVVLYDNGEIYYQNLKKSKLDLNEFLMQCRVGGYFDLSNLQTIVLEPNGHLSLLPKAEYRPVNPEDLKLQPKAECLVANVVIDGRIMYENLKHTGNDEKWLMNQIHAQQVSELSKVLLATCDCHNKLTVYAKIDEPRNKDVLE